MLMRSSRLLAAIAAIGGLSACASMTDTPNQNIFVETPGATGARCVLSTQYARYVVYPPQSVMMRRMAEPLNVTCQAPGNREKTVVVYSSLNKAATANIATVGVGAVYDRVSGALYEYPSRIVVDFSHTRAGNQDMPKYHAPDTVSPFDQINEDMQDGPALKPQEQGLKLSSPKKSKNLISKEEQSLKDYKTEIERPY